MEAERDQVIGMIGRGQLNEAEKICRDVVDGGGPPEFLYLLAVVKTEQGRPAEALPLFERATMEMPDRADVAYAHGVARQAAGDLDEAVRLWQRALSLDAGHREAGFNLAKGLDEQGNLAEARDAYERVLALNGGHVAARYNLANLLFRNNDFASARDQFVRLIEVAPSNPDAWLNLGMAEKALGNLNEAERACRRVLEFDPDSVEAHWNLANLLLLRGRWDEGFAEYEWRLRRSEAPKPDWPDPLERGGDVTGKRVMLWSEQGTGDAIQFLRHAADVAGRTDRVMFFCHPSLRRLAEICPGVAEAFSYGDSLPAFDVHAPVCSLPHLLGKTNPENTWPGAYLNAPAAASLDAPKGFLKAGLVWAGNPNFAYDHLRSFEAEVYLPLLDVPGTAFFSLQAGDVSAEQAGAAFRDRVTDLAPGFKDFADTAAAIAALDLVVTSDTSVAHLAGAMGRPTWLLLHTLADWRWLRDRDDSPWYPSMRLFRQRTLGDWDAVAQDVAQALGETVRDLESARA